MFLPALILLVASLVVLAIDEPVYITVPTKVTAATPFQATLEANVRYGYSSFSSSFRVYLAMSYEDKAHDLYSSDCYLIHEQTLCDASVDVSSSDSVDYHKTKFNVTIPASVGPAGRHYVLKAQTLNTDGSYYGPALESDVFELTGANGTWASYQKEGSTLWGDDALPCTSFACVKNCAGNSTRKNPTSADDTFHKCANACPSVSIDFVSSAYGGQPTAALTTPSPCSVYAPSATNATTTEEPTGTAQASGLSATTSRSTTAAVGSNVATGRRAVSIALLGPIPLAVALFV